MNLLLPDLGVYLQPDPEHQASSSMASSPQAYAYVSGAPLRFSDPDGRLQVQFVGCSDCDEVDATMRTIENMLQDRFATSNLLNLPMNCSSYFSANEFVIGSGPTVTVMPRAGIRLEPGFEAAIATRTDVNRSTFTGWTPQRGVPHFYVAEEWVRSGATGLIANTLIHETRHTTQTASVGNWRAAETDALAVAALCGYHP